MNQCKFYSARKRRDDRRLRKLAKARAEKAAKREQMGAVATLTAGWVVFGGPLFGKHRVRLTCREDAPDHIQISVDGKITCTKTQRGVRALLMRRIAAALT